MKNVIETLKLLNTVGTIKGRKKLQKIIHILQSQGYDFRQDFGYLHYGPYSSEVAAEVDTLCGSGLILEQKVQDGYDTYVYTASEGVPGILKELKADAPPVWASLAKALNGKETPFLEAVSTILYLIQHGFSGTELQSQFFDLKPKLAARFDEAWAYAQSLKPGEPHLPQ